VDNQLQSGHFATGQLTVELTTLPTAHAYSLYEWSTMHKLTHFYYTCLNYPVVSTFIKAINAGYLRGWPGLTADHVRQHINISVESKQGHMNQVRKGLRSTQPTSVTVPIVLLSDRVNSNMDGAPQKPANIHTHHIFMMVHVATGRVSSDNTGCFLVTSNWGNAYLALFYIYDANAIWSVLIKNRSKEKLLQAITEVYAWLTARGYPPILHNMENETSHGVKAFILSEQVKLQYSPPNMHHTNNPAKRAVCTWNNHFTAGLAGLPPSFSIGVYSRTIVYHKSTS
jgi:hypothetical protein